MKTIVNYLKTHALRILTIIFWVSLVGSYFYYKEFHQLSNEQIMRAIYSFLKREWAFWWVVFVLIYTLRAVIFFPSSLLIILSPSLFGLPMAIFYSILWENFSASFGYLLWKLFGRNILSESFLDKFAYLKKKMREDSFLTLLSLRLIFTPFDPLSYISWFFKAEYSWYLWWTLLGTIPSVLIFIFAWAGIRNIESFKLKDLEMDEKYLFLSILTILLSLILVYVLRKRKKIIKWNWLL